MQRFAIWVVLAATLASGSLPAQEKKKSADTFIRAADAGPDFEIQGEYEAIGQDKMGAQVVALGNGSFDVYLLTGGLPGAGWDEKSHAKVAAKTVEGKVVVAGSDQGVQGTIADGKLVTTDKAAQMTTFKRVLRQSPTLGAKPPDGAVVLFDGTSVEEWNGGKLVEDNLLNCGTNSKKKFATGKLHVEFRTPFMPKARGQGRGNSGVFVLGREIQVLDSFGLEGKKNECGAFYNAAKPLVNLCLPPLSWQTYDVEIKPGENQLLASVWHNGVKVHDNFPIGGATSKPAPMNLQNHGNPVVFKNIWFVLGVNKN